MKSKVEIVNEQNCKKDKHDKYVKLMEKALENRYKNGLNFNKIPHHERIVWYGDFVEDIHFYTNIEKEYIEAIKDTKTFSKISKLLVDNGYEYNLSYCTKYSTISERVDWGIYLNIN